MGWSDTQSILINLWNLSLNCYFSRECFFWQNGVEDIGKESPFSFKPHLQTRSTRCHGSCKVFCSLCHRKKIIHVVQIKANLIANTNFQKHSHNIRQWWTVLWLNICLSIKYPVQTWVWRKFIFQRGEGILQVLHVVLPMTDIVSSLLAYVCEKMSFNQYSITLDVTYCGFINKRSLLVPIFVHKNHINLVTWTPDMVLSTFTDTSYH